LAGFYRKVFPQTVCAGLHMADSGIFAITGFIHGFNSLLRSQFPFFVKSATLQKKTALRQAVIDRRGRGNGYSRDIQASHSFE
jgi:hypothetical protein